MPRQKKPQNKMSTFKRSSFNNLLKVASIEDFEFDEAPKKFDVVRYGTYKEVNRTSSYVEYKSPKSAILLRINL